MSAESRIVLRALVVIVTLIPGLVGFAVEMRALHARQPANLTLLYVSVGLILLGAALLDSARVVGVVKDLGAALLPWKKGGPGP